MREVAYWSGVIAAVFGCAAPARPAATAPKPSPPVAAVAVSPLAGCGMPGRERCGPEPVIAGRVPELVRLACAESCSKAAMESVGVIAPAPHPPDKKRAEMSLIQRRLLACFASCEKVGGDLSATNMPPGVEPCTVSAPRAYDTQCLTYSCEYYGDQRYMLPAAQRDGEGCEIPSNREPGTCWAGSCVPTTRHMEACSASAIHLVVREWMLSLRAEQECTRPGATRQCQRRPLGFLSRYTLLGYLDCKTLWEEQHGPLSPLAPWGHWPVSLTEPESK